MNLKSCIWFFPVLLLFFYCSCTTPTTHQLVKDGGYWNIESLKYTIINNDKTTTDTTFYDCGEVYFKAYQNTEEEDEPRWTIEGYIIEPYSYYENNEKRWIWSTYYFTGTSRTWFMEISSNMNIWNYQFEEFVVKKNTGAEMEWEHANWNGDRIWYYKLKKK